MKPKKKTHAAAPVIDKVQRVLIQTRCSPDVQWQLKQIAAAERKSVQKLVGEALNLLFATRGEPQIALDE